MIYVDARGVAMKSELQITFRDMEPVKHVEDWIRSEVVKLEILYGQVIGCRVALEVPHRHHRKGNAYHIRVDMTVPGGEIVVKREPSLRGQVRRSGELKVKKHVEVNIAHKDLHAAIRDAFKAASRRLQDYARRQRGAIKTRSPLPEGRVSKILRDEGYGFLTSVDGREIYFHKNSIGGGAFEQLEVGTPVRFAEEPGEKGPQASTVRVIPLRRLRQAAKGVAV
jgi:cold shock CspA family protein